MLPHRKFKEGLPKYTRTQLLILCALGHIGKRHPHHQLKLRLNCLTPFTRHSFWCSLIICMYSIRDDHIYFPRNLEECWKKRKIFLELRVQSMLCTSNGATSVPQGTLTNANAKNVSHWLDLSVLPATPGVYYGAWGLLRSSMWVTAPIQYGTHNDKHIVILQLIQLWGWYALTSIKKCIIGCSLIFTATS
jgi:hypothetical protein